MKNAVHRARSFFIAPILLVLSAALSSCGGLLSQEPTPTWTPNHTPTPTATLTPTPTLPYTEWPVAVSESFNEENDDWPVGEINTDLVRGTVAVLGGKYYVKLTAKKPVYWYSFPTMEALADVYATLKVDQLAGSKTAEYGIIVRAGDTLQYLFSISTLQQGYEFIKFSGDGESLLTFPTNSSKILIGEPNRIGVRALGPDFTFFINGEAVDDARDSEAPAGTVGIGIVLHKAGDWIEITFDNFEVRAPSGN
ncbi:MAG: hypothetical protein JW748_09245 [Anaerolineales bacterium]|nr:hypothetical protein [Anaerolineales bacterium]